MIRFLNASQQMTKLPDCRRFESIQTVASRANDEPYWTVVFGLAGQERCREKEAVGFTVIPTTSRSAPGVLGMV